MNGDGISKVFGGSCAFRTDDTGALFIGCYWKSCVSVLRQGW